MIDPADLDSIRDEVKSFLPQSALIRRKNVASDGRGGTIEDWFDLTTVDCRLDFPVGDERTVADRYGQTTTGRLKVAYGTDLKATDRVIVDPAVGDSAAVLRQKTYEVTYVQQTVYDGYRQADVVRVAGA